VLEGLRQPLEEGVVRIARARASATFPAKFQLVAAMNPCPCGYATVKGRCQCSVHERSRYARRLSGPLLDRFDLAVSLLRPDVGELLGGSPGESTAVVAERVTRARILAAGRGVCCNSELSHGALQEHAHLSTDASAVLERRLYAGSLSARGLERVRRVARTIADLEGGAAVIQERHVAEALQLRAARAVLMPAGER
jgi:magnesium chelatase family protein